MRLVRLTSAEDPLFAKAMALYRQSFPPYEQREDGDQRAIMGHTAYHFNLICDQGAFVGLLLFWETDDYIYVEHFCVDPALRNQRYGQRALELLEQRGKTVILEIDPPEDEISIRRQGFYRRMGYQENPYAHMQPPYRKGDREHPLVILSHPAVLTQEVYDRFVWYLRNVIMKP